MNEYCKRDNTLYNRCYCSSRLAQIDANYKPALEDIERRLVIMQNGGGSGAGMSDEELEEFWQNTFFQHTGENSMASLNDSLSINWPDPESNMRGQKAFAIGHEYCEQHLRGCFYMTTNLRDAYRSEIARDCTAYERYLNKLKLAGESVLSATGD
jgi:hypothetical protein